jgi:hypothetical protein
MGGQKFLATFQGQWGYFHQGIIIREGIGKGEEEKKRGPGVSKRSEKVLPNEKKELQ